jgi:hypothetical protein
VVVADYHTVTADSSSRTLVSGRQITVSEYGMLEVWSDLTVESGAIVYVQGGLIVSAYFEVQGNVQVESGGWLDDYTSVTVIYGGSIDASGSVYAYPYSNFDLVYGASLNVSGDFYQDWSAYSYLYQGGSLTVGFGGWAYFDGETYVEDYSQLTVYGDAEASGGNIEVRYNGELRVESGGSFDCYSYINVVDGGYLYVNGEMTIEGGLYAYGNAQIIVEYSGSLTINGYATIDYYSTFVAYNGGKVIVGRWGSLEAYYYGSIYFDYQSRSDLFGYFRLYYDAYLYLGSDAVVRVYRGMDISGQMDSGGGKIVMMRREGRINDSDGDSLFVFDQAYGFEPHLIA